MKVLLSIKPEYADKIFSGEKKFEFRKCVFKNKAVKTVVVYASSPVKKVIGEFDIDCIIEDSPNAIWEKTKQASGITLDFFTSYFFNKEKAFAIKVKTCKLYDLPLCIKRDFNVKPPQSFLYLS